MFDLFKVSRFAGPTNELPQNFSRPGPSLQLRKENRETGLARFSQVMADFIAFPCFGESGHGVRRQSLEV
jgi:hypothetical protein